MVTVLIFSYNRHSYLRRALAYWASSGYQVIIADGSDNRLAYDFPSNVKYLHRPHVSIIDRILEMVSIANTPFVALGTDDDFIALNGLAVVAKFLNENSDYSSAQGYYTRFYQHHLNSTPIWDWDYRYASNYSFLDIAMESRLHSAMKPPVMHYCYSVMKGDVMKKTLGLLSGVDEMSISTFELSFIPGLMSQGKHTVLPVFFGARQAQQRSWTDAIKLDVWVERNAVDGYAKWRMNVCRLLQNENGLSREEATRIIDDSMIVYLKGYPAKVLGSEQHLADPTSFKAAIWRTVIRSLSNKYSRSLYESMRICGMLGFDLKMFNLFRRDWSKIKMILAHHPIAEINHKK
jgi:glycosyltransferase domain-containing protein